MQGLGLSKASAVDATPSEGCSSLSVAPHEHVLLLCLHRVVRDGEKRGKRDDQQSFCMKDGVD